MPAPLFAVKTHSDLPTHADVVVIGGGIIGTFAAYYLAKRGLKVALVEKGRVGAEQSSRNWGWCRQQNRDARELPMATKSLDLWEQFTAETGEETGFQRCGLLYLSNSEKELAGWARWGEFARTVDVKTQMLTADEAAQRGRVTGKPWKGGVFAPTDGIADPSRAAPAVARAIMKLGGTVHQGCAARGVETEAVCRRHREGNHPHEARRARRRSLGVLLLPPVRHPVSPGGDPPDGVVGFQG